MNGEVCDEAISIAAGLLRGFEDCVGKRVACHLRSVREYDVYLKVVVVFRHPLALVEAVDARLPGRRRDGRPRLSGDHPVQLLQLLTGERLKSFIRYNEHGAVKGASASSQNG